MYRRSRSACVAVCAVWLASCVPLSSSSAALRDATPPGPARIDVQRQVVKIQPVFAEQMLKGEQSVTFQTITGGDSLRFAGGPLKVAAVQIDGSPVQAWRMTEGVFEIALNPPLRSGSRHTVHLTYEAQAGRGVHISDDLAYTTYFSCDWMLCSQQDFDDRFTFDLTIRAPHGMSSLGPGELSGVATSGADDLHHWRTLETFPAYVHAFAVGRLNRFEPSAGCATRLEVLSTAPREQVDAIFQPACAMLAYFEQRSGVAYPADRYSQLYDPTRWEAQEAISHSVLGGGAVSPMLADPADDWAVAHELAHQWWGNRITAKDLTEFWLNEGVVTFIVASWKEHRWGAEAYAREIEAARGRWRQCVEQWRDAPLAFDGTYPSIGTRRCFQYSKAAVFLHELRTVMGDEPFWNGLRRYTIANLGRSVTSKDFEAAMQGETRVDLAPLFAEWVYSPSS